MRTNRLSCGLLAGSLLLFAGTAEAQRGRSPGGEERQKGPLEVHEEPEGAGIAWFGTWDQALAEAQRTGRPILFHSAAPQCQSVPGVW